ncbi:hypothetical protein vseg_020672 [Gypsophila vaccaria]
MARSLSLARRHLTTTTTTTTTLLPRRYKSTRPEYAVARPKEEEEEKEGEEMMRRLEEAVNRVVVKRAQPDWIPLVPGGSYWVPPIESSRGFHQLVSNLVKHSTPNESNKNKEGVSVRVFNSTRGWPSSAHFFIGSSHTPLEGEMTFKSSKKSEDEEG